MIVRDAKDADFDTGLEVRNGAIVHARANWSDAAVYRAVQEVRLCDHQAAAGA